MEFNLKIFILQAILMIILFIIIYFTMKFYKTLKLEKKMSMYSIDSIEKDDISIFDKINKLFYKVVKNISKVLSKSKILTHMSKKYDKYIDLSRKKYKLIDYTSIKLLIILGLLLIVVIFDIFQFKSVKFIQLIVVILVGYFGFDLVLFINRKLIIKNIDEDLLKAIIIMNNAFKSGRTTMQAVKIVKNELSGYIGEEFSKMYTDLSFGLSIDKTFERFAKRIDNDDAKYIASSLIVLNNTGGNIVNVFSSIENSFFTRRKLQNELKSLTASANLMVKALTFAPIVIFLIIFLLNTSYFVPLISTTIGLIILGLIILIYISYIIVIRRALKIDV